MALDKGNFGENHISTLEFIQNFQATLQEVNESFFLNEEIGPDQSPDVFQRLSGSFGDPLGSELQQF